MEKARQELRSFITETYKLNEGGKTSVLKSAGQVVKKIPGKVVAAVKANPIKSALAGGALVGAGAGYAANKSKMDAQYKLANKALKEGIPGMAVMQGAHKAAIAGTAGAGLLAGHFVGKKLAKDQAQAKYIGSAAPLKDARKGVKEIGKNQKVLRSEAGKLRKVAQKYK